MSYYLTIYCMTVTGGIPTHGPDASAAAFAKVAESATKGPPGERTWHACTSVAVAVAVAVTVTVAAAGCGCGSACCSSRRRCFISAFAHSRSRRSCDTVSEVSFTSVGSESESTPGHAELPEVEGLVVDYPPGLHDILVHLVLVLVLLSLQAHGTRTGSGWRWVRQG